MPNRQQAAISRLILMFLVIIGVPVATAADIPVVISIRAIPGMQYDVVRFHVKPRAKVKLRFFNADDMDHNLLILKPGSRETVVQKALEMGADGSARNFIPATDDVLWHFPLLSPEEGRELTFTAPSRPGAYPYVCTYPGHGLVMYGVMYVSEDEQMPLPEDDAYIPPARRKESIDTSGHAHETTMHALRSYTGLPPYLYRVYIDGASPAAIVVNLPGNISYCWDAGTCKLRLAWSDGFVDNADLWKGKGDAEAKIVGNKFFQDKQIYPLITDRSDLSPEVRYKGYRLLNNYPEFHYLVNETEVFELIKQNEDSSGLIRTFRIIDAKQDVWFITNPGNGVRWVSSAGKWEKGRLKLSPAESDTFTITMNKRNL